MKKYIAIFLALALCLALAACAQKANDGGNENRESTENGENKTPESGVSGSENDGITDDNGGDVNGDVGGSPEDSLPEGGEDNQAPEDGEDNDSAENNGDDENTSEDSETPEGPGGIPAFPVPGSGENSEDGDSEGGDTPSIAPGFPSIGFPGAGSGETEDIPVADAGDLVDKLAELCEGITPDTYKTATLYSSGSFANYFSGGVTYTEGMRVAENTPMMVPPAHIALLIEVPEGQDADEYAKELAENANPRWNICASAESVQSAARDGLVLFVMSSTEIADALISAFNG